MSHAQQLHNRRYLDGYMQIINRPGLPDNVRTAVCQQVEHAVLSTVQWTIEQALEEELTAYVGCERYEHPPAGRTAESTRSGYYRRILWTQYACLPDLRVPKLRRGNDQIPRHTITRYARCWGPLLDQQLLRYCLGLSLRDLQESMRLTLGEVLSLEACNRLVLALAERAQTWKTRRLQAPPPIVLVDGLWVKIAYPSNEIKVDAIGRRRAVKHKQKRVVLTALGVWPDGHWEIVHWKLAAQEDAEAWHTFCGELDVKGITAETTQLVVSDGTQGLPKALERHLPGVAHQRGIFHKIKNIADYFDSTALALDPTRPPGAALRQAKRTRKHAILADAGHIYSTDVEAEIQARAAVFRSTWEGREPQAVAPFCVDFAQTLSY